MDRHYNETDHIIIKKSKKPRPPSAGPSRKMISDNDFNDIQVPETCKTLGNKLLQIRLERKENQKTFSQHFTMKENIYKEIESGKAVLSSQQIQSIDNLINRKFK